MEESMAAAYTKVAEHLEMRRDNAQRQADREQERAEAAEAEAARLEAEAAAGSIERIKADLQRQARAMRLAAGRHLAAYAAAKARSEELTSTAGDLRAAVNFAEEWGLVWPGK